MKKKIIITAVLTLAFGGGAVAASSINGEFNGSPVVKIRVDNKEIHSEVPGHIVEGSTLLPLRAISESLGANVQWHQEDYSVDITMPNKGLTLSQLNNIGQNVAVIYAVDASGKYIKQGSGVLLANGVVVTNNHIGSAGKSLRIDVNGGSFVTNGEYLFKSDSLDLFAVKIDAAPVALAYANELPGPGEPIYSLAFPRAKFEINEGLVISATQAKITNTAKSDPGSSGGLLINSKGQMIGVMAAGSDTMEYNEAIPLKNVLQELSKVK